MLLIVSLCELSWLNDVSAWLDGTKLSQALTRLTTDGLRIPEIQGQIDKLEFHEESVSGASIILSLTSEIAEKFTERFKVVQSLKQAVEESYNRSHTYFGQWECCQIEYRPSNLEYDARFRQRVDVQRACVKISGTASKKRRYLDELVVSKMKQISNDFPFIKWQFFGSAEGMLTLFPAFGDKASCSGYDPRLRPWYVETAIPEPKDVVLVVDTSGSIGTNLMNITKEAAKILFSTMNPRDRIGVVSFGTVASTPGKFGKNCFSERLADATPLNLRYLEGYLESLKAQGVTNYAKAFSAAFRLLKNSYDGPDSTRKLMIFFLTDGLPSDDKANIMRTIKESNAELHNKVVIMTYGMLFAKKILLDIANQDGTSYGVDKTQNAMAGNFTSIDDTTNLRNTMGKYYDFFFKSGASYRPIISVPYIDAFGTGLLTTVALPVYHENKFIGVVGTDVSMEDIQYQINYLQRGQASYAFMANSFGRAMLHPLLPAPLGAFEDPIFIDIADLEPEPQFRDIVKSIMRGGDGNKTFVSKQFLARGGKVAEGVRVVELYSTYYWKSIPETSFTVGIVVPVGDSEGTLVNQTISPAAKFVYHRLDLVKLGEPCVHFTRYASKDAVVKFSAEAFTDPYNYLGSSETASTVAAYQKFLKQTNARNPGFKLGIRDTVRATRMVEDIWIQGSEGYMRYLVRQYIGTKNGVFLLRPGTLLAKSFDPTKRPWYNSAISNKGLITLTTPFMDADGAGPVISVVHSLYFGKRNNTNDHVFGVTGADIPLSYFTRLLRDGYPECKSGNHTCFLLDAAGFLILYDDFLFPNASAKTVEYVHITEKDKDLAEDLINRRFMKRKKCRDLRKLKLELFYEFQLPSQGANTLFNGKRCRRYQLSQLDGSNIILGIKLRERNCPTKPCTCSGDGMCSRKTELTCQCPCSSELSYDHCRNAFLSNRFPLCPPSRGILSTENVTDLPTTGLPKCFNPRCVTYPDWESCVGVAGCYWCVRDKRSKPLTTKYCADRSVCYGGMEVSVVDSIDYPKKNHNKTNDDRKGLPKGAIAGIVVGCLFLFISIIGCVIFYHKYCHYYAIGDSPDVQLEPSAPPCDKLFS
ncbi:VWFA and cache domain-containing protein 1 [Stylophora pistillata]|uniref:VWFA and cache domain-containing protein 1 n=2 Tax=Stylophora pistillata TaxID=50429 RepID=A0A2B4S6E8_STYPI|nr:VWFA and cache domain-containing protein 1 [Stylophora pistillata]